MLDAIHTNKKRSSLRAIFAMAKINVETWRSSPKTIIAVLFTIAVCYAEMRAYQRDIIAAGFTVYFGETLYDALSVGCNISMTSILLLLTVTELPRRIPYQGYALVRGTRREWLGGQLLYCAGLSLFTLLLITLCASIFSLTTVSQGTGWSDPARLAAGEIEEWEALIPTFVREGFTPFTACVIATIPIFFFWFTMLCIILLFSILGAPLVGLAIYTFLLWMGLIFNFNLYPGMMLPKYFAILRDLPIAQYGMGYYWKVIAGYILIDGTLIGIMLLQIKHTDMVFASEGKF